jgi:flavin reductase (DIM6/NTAB) family NADH-FMN oxidoreductase RutF
MKEVFREISPYDINDNVFRMIGTDWMLITAGNREHYNTMTAAWGAFGFLWKKPVTVIFIRPQRYTFRFAEEYERYTLCFFDEKYRKTLNYFGTVSGRDEDKVAESGLKILHSPYGSVYFEECRLMLECRKLYADDIKENCFVDTFVRDKIYMEGDFHRFYIGEPELILKKE